ncbi:chromatin binding protein, partial [Blyttiomyces sp. JEL0837]
MNLELIDPFSSDFPEAIEYRFVLEGITTCCFNSAGNLLAGGFAEGSVAIWDMDTKAIDSKYLLTTSKDWNCIMWNLARPEKEYVLRFSSPILSAALHPLDGNKSIVCALNESPTFIERTLDSNGRPLISKSRLLDNLSSDFIQSTVVCFDNTGDRALIGSAKGVVYVVDLNTKTTLYSTKVSTGSSAVKGIQLSLTGRDVVVNSMDKVIRCFALQHNSDGLFLEPRHKFLDSVDQSKWAQCCFSADSEYVVGGSSAKHMHKIYIWEKVSGALVKMLEGPKEGLLDISWHPTRPILASVSAFGVVYIWTVTVHENWSAFAPDFQELEENIEYEEHEDEFDKIEE